MKLIDLFQIMGLDEPIIIRHVSKNYHTTPDKFMKEQPELCDTPVLFQSMRYSDKHEINCIMIRLSGLNNKEGKRNDDC